MMGAQNAQHMNEMWEQKIYCLCRMSEQRREVGVEAVASFPSGIPRNLDCICVK